MMIIGKFFFYKMPELTEKVLPLTVLLSSILTFGTFAENYEFAAMKASGISLKRAMISIILFVVLLGGMTFFFANSVIPASEQKIFNLRRNIAKLKPAVAIAEGVFSDFESADMNIKVDNKFGDNDRFLENVIIHQKTKTNINYRVIKAKTGELISGVDSDIIQFDLEEERDIETAKMKNIARLGKDIDSLKKDNLRIIKAFSKNIVSSKMGAFTPLPERDTTETKKIIPVKAKKEVVIDSIKSKELIDNIVDLYPEWQQVQLMNNATNNMSAVLSSIKGKRTEMGKRYELHRRHIFSLHDKFALAFSCIILFFVGAPLGAIIRKGGLGLPMVIAIILFLIYYFVGVFAENYSNKGNIHPILGAWTSTSVFKKKKEDDVMEINLKSDYSGLSNLELDKTKLTFNKRELELLIDSLQFINNYSSNLYESNIEEFISIHRRNIEQVISIGKIEKSGFLFDQINNYPELNYTDLYDYLNKGSRQKRFTIVDLIVFIINKLGSEDKSEDDVEFNLKQVGEINNVLILTIQNFVIDLN